MPPPEVGLTSIRFRPIDPARNEVRFLELQPAATGDIDERVVCRLVHERLSEASNFIGLSLLYGDIAARETVLLNGSLITIPENVAQALRYVRAVFLSPLPPTPNSSTASLPSQTSVHHQGQQLHPQEGQEKAQQDWRLQQASRTDRPPSSPTPLQSTTALSLARPSQTPSSATSPQPLPSAKAPRWFLSLFRNFRHRRTETAKTGRIPPIRVWIDLLCINRQSELEESERRSHMARAYGHAKMVVGWLGTKDPTSDLAVEIIRAWDKCMPESFGEPGDREVNPNNYGPVMQWMGPVAHLSDLPEGVTDPRQVPAYVAITNFLNRPYFRNTWLLEDMASAKFPAFLLGDDIVSWMQVLRINRVNEEIRDRGAGMFPDNFRPLLEYLPLGSVYAFLKEFDLRRRTEAREHPKPATSGSATSSHSLILKPRTRK